MDKELKIIDTSNLTTGEIKNIAEEKATYILLKIKENNSRVTIAKQKANDAKNMKIGLFGIGNKKKTNGIANAVVATNEALAEMNELIQECIRFSCASIKFATTMSETISRMVVSGFKNRDGKIIHLTNAEKEMAEMIISEADNFTKNQLEMEHKQLEQNERIQSINQKMSIKDKVDKEQTERLNKIEEILDIKDGIDTEQNDKINALQLSITEKERIDAEQTEKLNVLEKLINSKKSIDDKQQEEIELLFSYMKQKEELDKSQDARLLILETKKPLVLSIISMVLTVCAIAISLFVFFTR